MYERSNHWVTDSFEGLSRTSFVITEPVENSVS
jgi:hypothetical protein